jgi:hypothetical protein
MNKNPYLQYRHCEGLGDLIACTLHSKLISPITSTLTGTNEICSSCDKRRQALNFLFPIKIWKLFFSDYESKNKHLDSFFSENNIDINEQENIIKLEKEQTETNETQTESCEGSILTGIEHRSILPKNSIILREIETEINDIFFKTIIYKK